MFIIVWIYVLLWKCHLHLFSFGSIYVLLWISCSTSRYNGTQIYTRTYTSITAPDVSLDSLGLGSENILYNRRYHRAVKGRGLRSKHVSQFDVTTSLHRTFTSSLSKMAPKVIASAETARFFANPYWNPRTVSLY